MADANHSAGPRRGATPRADVASGLFSRSRCLTPRVGAGRRWKCYLHCWPSGTRGSPDVMFYEMLWLSRTAAGSSATQ